MKKIIIKKKLRYWTKKEYKIWKKTQCNTVVDNCDSCRFATVNCGIFDNSWVNHKDMYSDNFLNQEVEVIKLTKRERIILDSLCAEWKYIVRDEDNRLFLFDEKPDKYIPDNNDDDDFGSWLKNGGKIHCLEFPFCHMFDFVEWEDEEPCLIEDLLKE